MNGNSSNALRALGAPGGARRGRHGSPTLRVLAALVSCVLLPALASAAGLGTSGTWPQWRGPERTGAAPAAPAWPADLKNLASQWRVELGKGYPGPIVAEDRVFVVETVDAETAWTNKATAYMSSPAVIDGHAYLHLGNHQIFVRELEALAVYHWAGAVSGDK